MSAATRPRYTIAEYLRLEAYSNTKHEYLDGQIFAMAGGTSQHARVAAAIVRALGNQLEGRRCATYTSDMRVRVVGTGLDTYPDVTVICGQEDHDVEDRLAVTNPVVLVEVMSETSERYDRGEKFDHYKRIPALREYVLASHHEPRLEVFRRADDGAWSLAETAAPGGRVKLVSIDCELLVDAVYRDPLA